MNIFLILNCYSEREREREREKELLQSLELNPLDYCLWDFDIDILIYYVNCSWV